MILIAQSVLANQGEFDQVHDGFAVGESLQLHTIATLAPLCSSSDSVANPVFTSAINVSCLHPLAISLDSINLIIPHFRGQTSLLNRKGYSLSPTFLDIDKEPNDDAGEDTIDESSHQPSDPVRKDICKLTRR